MSDNHSVRSDGSIAPTDHDGGVTDEEWDRACRLTDAAIARAKALDEGDERDASFDDDNPAWSRTLLDALRDLRANRLEVCSLTFVRFNEEQLFAFCTFVARSNTLRHVRLYSNHFKGEDMRLLGPALASSGYVNQVELRDSELGEVGFEHLFRAIAASSRIRILHVMECSPTGRAMEFVGECIRGNTVLEELDLRNNELRDDTAIPVGDALLLNTTLRKLSLKGNSIGPRGIKSLSRAMKAGRAMRVLNLRKNPIYDEGVRYIADALSVSDYLHVLDISDCGVAAEGAAVLAAMLRVDRGLYFLNLFDNPIGDAGARYLAEALKWNRALKNLYLGPKTRITAEGGRALAAAVAVGGGAADLQIAPFDDERVDEELQAGYAARDNFRRNTDPASMPKTPQYRRKSSAMPGSLTKWRSGSKDLGVRSSVSSAGDADTDTLAGGGGADGQSTAAGAGKTGAGAADAGDASKRGPDAGDVGQSLEAAADVLVVAVTDPAGVEVAVDSDDEFEARVFGVLEFPNGDALRITDLEGHMATGTYHYSKSLSWYGRAVVMATAMMSTIDYVADIAVLVELASLGEWGYFVTSIVLMLVATLHTSWELWRLGRRTAAVLQLFSVAAVADAWPVITGGVVHNRRVNVLAAVPFAGAGSVSKLKTSEALIESGPQGVLQLFIGLQRGFSPVLAVSALVSMTSFGVGLAAADRASFQEHARRRLGRNARIPWASLEFLLVALFRLSEGASRLPVLALACAALGTGPFVAIVGSCVVLMWALWELGNKRRSHNVCEHLRTDVDWPGAAKGLVRDAERILASVLAFPGFGHMCLRWLSAPTQVAPGWFLLERVAEHGAIVGVLFALTPDEGRGLGLGTIDAGVPYEAIRLAVAVAAGVNAVVGLAYWRAFNDDVLLQQVRYHKSLAAPPGIEHTPSRKFQRREVMNAGVMS